MDAMGIVELWSRRYFRPPAQRVVNFCAKTMVLAQEVTTRGKEGGDAGGQRDGVVKFCAKSRALEQKVTTRASGERGEDRKSVV